VRIPIVAIIGKPNVGKSSLFNRIFGKRQAVVANEAGTTRDRIIQKIETKDSVFFLVDTGGIQLENDNSLEDDVLSQAQLAVKEADIIIFLVDSQTEFTSDDNDIAEILRKQKKDSTKIFLVLSKCDSNRGGTVYDRTDAYTFGFGEPICVASIHNFGVDQLLNEIDIELKNRDFVKPSVQVEENTNKDEKKDTPKIAVLGRPNVGKSSFINALLNVPKLIVSDVAGTTRDSTDSLVKFQQEEYVFVDTAGIRRRGKVVPGIEKFSVMRSMTALMQSDIVLMMLDGSKFVSKQDQHIAGEILDEKKGLILVVNKWDLTDQDEEAREKYIRHLRYKFAFMPWAPVVFVSAKNKKNISKIFPIIKNIILERQKRITTAKLNDFQQETMHQHMPTGTKNIKPKIYYVTQTGVNPPEFVLFVNNTAAIHFSYRRYLENKLRKVFGFNGTGIRMVYREKDKRRRKK